MKNHLFATFDGHKHWGSRDIIILFCHVISEGSRNLDQRVTQLYAHEPIKVIYHSAKFGGHRHCGGRYKDFKISRDLVRQSDQKVQ